MTKERVESIRKIVLPFIAKKLKEIDYEGLGESDAKEFTNDFNEILKLAEDAIEQDCISRQAVKDLMRSLTRWCVRSEDGRFNNVGLLYDDVMFGIDRLPSGSSSEKPKSEWEHDHEILKAYSDGASAVLESLIEQYEHYLELLDADMKDGSATIVTKTKYAVYTEVVEQLKEVLESEGKA